MPFNYWDERLYLYGTDLNTLILVKSRTNHSCILCKKKIPKGSYIYGRSYIRICINCAEEYFNKNIIQFKKYVKLIQDTKKNLNKNKKEYQVNNALANI